jgi:hypothetical protein
MARVLVLFEAVKVSGEFGAEDAAIPEEIEALGMIGTPPLPARVGGLAGGVVGRQNLILLVN